MNKLIALVAVSVLVLAGCSSGTSYTSNVGQISSENFAAAVENAKNTFTGRNEAYRLGIDMPVGEYYLVEGSDYYMRPRDVVAEVENKNEVPTRVINSRLLEPYMLVNDVPRTNFASTDPYSYFQDVSISSVGYKPSLDQSITAIYAPGLYKVGVDIPVGTYTLKVIPVAESRIGSYSIYSSDSKELIEHREFQARTVIDVVNGQYLETFNSTITSN